MKLSNLAILTATITGVAAAGFAASHARTPAEIAARKGQMQLISVHMGVIGNMARGNIDYDAAAAQEAADNLAAIGMISQTLLWPEDTAGHEESRALPAIWEDRAGFDAAWDDFSTATVALQGVAGDGLDALRGGLGGVGRTCGTCHDTYRASAN
ncbi:cytochrome c [Jannaschia sp. 2305UL9-9]|uniref:c-type cytochrome n=1 Tax=Jannaschia sp. 2305UL9-9 TaxID=3121638 RepID=UPI0035285EBC